MPDMSGVELLRSLKTADLQIPSIVITGHGDVPMAVEAMKAGALDFIEKPFEEELLIEAVKRAAAQLTNTPDSRSAKGPSLLGRSGTLNFGSTPSKRRYLRMVFRERPVLRQISRIDKRSRKCQRRITLDNAMSITP